MSLTRLVSMIPEWVALTAGREVVVGLSSEDALRRATVMRALLRDGKLDPTRVVLDEDLKAVFHALVVLVTEFDPRGGEALAQEANAVYQFLARIAWPDDDFGERKDLLTQCAEAGWRVLGTSLAEVEKRRTETQERPGQVLHHFSADPISMLLATSIQDRTEEQWETVLLEPDAILTVCAHLRKGTDRDPQGVAREVPVLYSSIANPGREFGLFDERDYFLGKIALLGGSAFRHLGRLDEAERWLDRAEAAFRHSVNPAPLLVKVAYARLALRYDMRRYDDVLELLPSLVKSFERLEMKQEVFKSRFLEALALKELGKSFESLDKLELLRRDLSSNDASLLGRVLLEIGANRGLQGDFDAAVVFYEDALRVMGTRVEPLTLADLKAVIAETYRTKGDLVPAANAYRLALNDYLSLGMEIKAAYCRVILSETLLALDRPREAEWEILQALPTIEEQKMVPEGFAAVALLRESVKRRKTDPNALRELREHLQKQK